MPFVVLVVLATNIKPVELVDEAFLRRIHYKVFAENPTVAEFKQILQPLLPRAQRRLRRGDRRPAGRRSTCAGAGIALRGCQPRDLIDHALALADYLGEPRRLTEALLSAACESYFLDDQVARRSLADDQ